MLIYIYNDINLNLSNYISLKTVLGEDNNRYVEIIKKNHISD